MEEKVIQIQLEQVMKDIQNAIDDVRGDKLSDMREIKNRVDELCARVLKIRTDNPHVIGQNILSVISRLEELQTEVEYYKDRMTAKMHEKS